MMRNEGFSFVETLLAVSLALGVAAVLLSIVGPARDALWTQPDAADMQQRLRVAADAIEIAAEGHEARECNTAHFWIRGEPILQT